MIIHSPILLRLAGIKIVGPTHGLRLGFDLRYLIKRILSRRKPIDVTLWWDRQ